MKEFVKKSILMGVGMAAMTKDKIEEIGKKLVNELEMSEDEGSSFIEDLKGQSTKAKNELEEKIRTAVEESIKKMGFATVAQINALEKRIANLEEEVTENDDVLD